LTTTAHTLPDVSSLIPTSSPAVATSAPAPVRVWHTGHLSLGNRLIYLGAVILPFVGLGLAIGLLWGVGFSWVHLGLLLGMYVFSAFGVTVGYHRLFTHRSFTTNRTVKAILAILGSMASEGPLFKWVAQHRMHHQMSDAPGDPHSPHGHGEGFVNALRGLWHAHVGWIFGGDARELDRYVGDLNKDGVLRVVSNLFPLWVALGMFIPALLGGLITMSWMGALLGFIWGGLARVFFVHHITWSINSVCHFWGSRPYDCHDESRNNFVFGVIGFGEGWHNNHHAFPTSARHGLKWWQFDASYWVIRGMELVGLAHKVKVPPAAALAAKAR
jgi:stearoyl-CoA desaturase (delta-9 desaturase)